jgi:hypothetical protein
MTKTSSTRTWGVADPGAGSVARNIAPPITIPRQVKSFRQQKIIMIPFVVARKKDSKKRTTVLEGIQDIVQSDGSLVIFRIGSWQRRIANPTQ